MGVGRDSSRDFGGPILLTTVDYRSRALTGKHATS
jgi:hypothetical protein